MKKLIYIVIALCFSLTISAQSSFHRLYKMNPDSMHILSDGLPTLGGGYATLGRSFGVVENDNLKSYRTMFTTYDAKGDIQLAKDIYLADSTYVTGTSDLVQNENGTFVFTANLEDADQSTAIVGLDNVTGTPIWSRRMSDELQFKSSLISLTDNEIIVGSTNVNEGVSIWLSKINGADGSDIWAKKYVAATTNGVNIPCDLIETHFSEIDSSVFITGQSDAGGIPGYHVTKLDKMGDVIWSTSTVSDPAGLSYLPISITETPDSSIYINGRVLFFDGINLILNNWLAKHDKNGDVVWSKVLIDANTFSQGNDIVPFGDNLAISVIGFDNLQGDPVFSTLYEVDSAGVVINSQIYRDSMTSFNLFSSLHSTDDGGLAYFSNFFDTDQEIFFTDFVKVEKDLSTPCSRGYMGTFDDLPTMSQALVWSTTDFSDVDTLQTDVNNINYYDVPTISPRAEQWCPNEPIIDTLDATPTPLPGGTITYEWTGPGVEGDTTASIVAMEEGEFIVVVTINEDQCYTLCDTVNISRLPEPTATIVQDDSKFCEEKIVVLTANYTGTPGFQDFVWNTGATTESITTEVAGTFSYSFTDACGEMGFAEATITLPENPAPTATIVQDDSKFCKENIVTLTANYTGTPGFQDFVWNTGATTESITTEVAGTFSYSFTDACGEIGFAEATITLPENPAPTATIVQDNSRFCEEEIIVLTAEYTGVPEIEDFVWNTGETTESITTEVAGTFSYSFMDACDEKGFAEITINNLPIEENGLMYPKVFFPNGIDEINRTFGPVNNCDYNITNYSLKIYNRWGNEVFTSTQISDEWDGNHNDSPSASAVYVWVAEYSKDGGESISLKGDVTLLRK